MIPRHGYAAGVDPCGGGTDEFVWSVVHVEGDRYIVDLVAARGKRGRQPVDLEAAVTACCQDLATYGLATCLGDRYAGHWVLEAFQRHGIRYFQTERPKSELYLALLPLLTMGRLELPADPELIKQAKLLERRRGSQGKDIVDHPVGAHDDRINSVALAIAGLPASRAGGVVLAGRPMAIVEDCRGAGGPAGILTSSDARSIQRYKETVCGEGGAGLPPGCGGGGLII